MKGAIRLLMRDRYYALLNVSGLGLGLAAALVILLYVWNQWRFDRFHSQVDQIHQLVLEESLAGRRIFTEGLPGGIAPWVQDHFAQVEAAARIINPPYISTWATTNTEAIQQQMCVADPEILEILTFKVLAGHLAGSLDHPNSLVITAGAAERLFGQIEAVGEVLEVDGFWAGNYQVTAVIADLPRQSSLQFDLLRGNVPTTFDGWDRSDWNPVHIFLRLQEQADASTLARELTIGTQGHLVDSEWQQVQCHLQPLKEIHLYSKRDFDFSGHGDIAQVKMLLLLALIILSISIVNFVNLTTARATQRMLEVGIRKTIGASRWQLVQQFLLESSILVFLAIGIALIATALLQPVVEHRLDISISPGPISLATASAIILGCWTGLTLLAGLYPAMVLTRFQPGEAFSGRLISGRDHATRTRQGLVFLQFVCTSALLVGAIIIHRQWDHLQDRHWGFSSEQVVVLPLFMADPTPMWTPQWLGFKQEVIKQAFIANPHVHAASVSHVVPPLSIDTEVTIPGTSLRSRYIYADRDFLDTYEIDLTAGRNLTRELLSDTLLQDILINESLVQAMNWSDPIGQKLTWETEGVELSVVGVISDFHNTDLTQPVQPLFITQMLQPPQFLSLRIDGHELAETLPFLETTWKTFLPSRPFQFRFADDYVSDMFAAGLRMARLMDIFTGLAIFLSCLGSFGLASYSLERRLKEMGLRKILGATPWQLFVLSSSGIIRMVLLASIVAWPITYYISRDWLAQFYYRMDISVVPFLAGLSLMIGLSLMTVCVQALKSATLNPVDVIRN